MNPRNRLNKLLEQARVMAGKRRRTIRRRQCHNATWKELLRLVEESTPLESWPIMEDILSQIEEYHRRPPRELANGEMKRDVHGFVQWHWGLREGWAELPETIPPVVLLAWRNGDANHPARSTPVPIRRCEDCRMVLPNCTANGFGSCIAPCPGCGSGRIGHMRLWAWGTFNPP